MRWLSVQPQLVEERLVFKNQNTRKIVEVGGGGGMRWEEILTFFRSALTFLGTKYLEIARVLFYSTYTAKIVRCPCDDRRLNSCVFVFVCTAYS